MRRCTSYNFFIVANVSHEIKIVIKICLNFLSKNFVKFINLRRTLNYWFFSIILVDLFDSGIWKLAECDAWVAWVAVNALLHSIWVVTLFCCQLYQVSYVLLFLLMSLFRTKQGQYKI